MAGWTGDWPLSTDTSRVTAWAMLDQLWQAAAEKRLCSGNEIHWPPANTSWGGGTITSITDNGDNSWTITDSTLANLSSGKTDDGRWWSDQQRSTTLCTSAKYWVGVQCNEGDDGGLPYFNGNYDLVIEDFTPGDWRDLKPWQVIRGAVTDNRNKTITATIRLADHVAAGYLSSPSSLVGKRFYLIRSGRLWWADKDFAKGRYPDFPNDPEEWRGTLDQGKVYDDGTGYLIGTTNKFPRDPYNVPVEPIAWTPDLFKTCEVLAYGGNLRRLTATGNDATTIFFGGLDHVPTEAEEAGTGDFEDAGPLVTSYTLSGNYSVVQPGRKAWPGRVGFAPFWWYGGAQDTLWTHDPSDQLTGRAMAFASDRVEWFELESLAGDVACGDDSSRVTHSDTLDNDMVS